MTTPNTGQPAATLTLRQRYELLRSQLDDERSSFISHWKELTDFIQPRRGRFTVGDNNRGDRRSHKILDSSATLAARTTAAGMQGGISSPARPWFRLSTADLKLNEMAAVKEWLYETTVRMRMVLLRSNFYKVSPQVYKDLAVFGTGAMAVLEDEDKVIRCQSFPIGSYWIANDENLQVRVFMREFTMSVRQLVGRFGYDKVSQSVKDNWDRAQYETRYEIMHVVAPNTEYDPTKDSLQSKDLPFKSCYYERGSHKNGETKGVHEVKELLEEKGFHEFPVLCPRWETTAEDTYGTDCPGMTALADIKMLQTGEKRSLQGLDKIVNPPLVGPTTLRGNRVSLMPGDVTYNDAQTTQGLRPIHETNLRLDQLENKQSQVRYRIDRAFFVDLFQMLQYADEEKGKQPVTAEEIRVRQEEKMLILGPVLENLNGDLFDPLIDRVFAIMERRGMLPPIPSELEGQPLRIEYVSIMAQAQKLIGLGSLERFSQFIVPLAQIDPSVLDKVDRDEIIDQYAENAGVPPSVIVPDEEVAQIRQARAAAAQKQAAVQQVSEAAKGAKTLSEADTSGKNALTDTVGSEGLKNMMSQLVS